MKVFLTIVVVAVIGFIVVLWIRPLEKGPEDYVYIYYPRPNVYHHVSSGAYYSKNKQNDSWTKRKEVSNKERDSYGKNVRISIYDEPFWKYNDKHQLIYGTKLYNSSASIKQKYYEDSIKSLPPKVVKPKAPNQQEADKEEEKKRSGFRRFIDKIFKKKNKE